MLFPVSGGRDAPVFLEGRGEIGVIAVADLKRDIADGVAALREQLRGKLHAFLYDVLADRDAPGLFKDTA